MMLLGKKCRLVATVFFFLILSCLSQTDVKQSGRVRLQNSAKILLRDPHLCTRILVSAMISL